MVRAFILLCVVGVRLDASVLPFEEMEALEDFYIATGGDNWYCDYYTGNPWIFSDVANPCDDDWIGLTCTAELSDGYRHVAELVLEDCHLAGSVPVSVGRLAFMTDLALSSNRLHGTIPAVFATLKKLSFLAVTANYLTGTLPPSLAQLPNIEILYLSGNNLYGHVDAAFDPVVQTRLQAVSLDHNAFSGQLPETLFLYPNLTELTIHHTCFSGTLPQTVCSAAGLTLLEMYCMSCNARCTTRPVTGSYYFVRNFVSGTVPACVFSLPSLRWLDLRYNYLTGTLPTSLNMTGPGKLDFAFLDYNALSGPVPTAIFPAVKPSNDSLSLSLSHNRLTGGMAWYDTPSWDFTIYLTYNRLSGPVLGGAGSANTEVLTGNIFGCSNGDRSRLPEDDSARDNYNCGSDSFNKPIIEWVCATAGLVVLCCCAWFWRVRLSSVMGTADLTERVGRWRSVLQGKHLSMDLPGLVRIRDVVLLLNMAAVAVAVGAVCILAPVYASLSASYGTYSHQYAWVLSAVLLSGRVPFAVCCAALLLALGGCVAALFRAHGSIAVPQQSGSNLPAQTRSHHRVVTASILYLVVNFGIVAAVNVSFVASSIYPISIVQLGVSAFKVGWNLFVAPYFSRWLAYELSAARADWFTLELFVSIMNNVGIPLLATILVSPQCLYNVFGIGFSLSVGVNVGRNSPFYYSYQCSYVHMDFYAAAFVYASIIASFGTPLVEQLVRRAQQGCPRESALHQHVGAVMPRILRPVESDPERVPDRSVLRPYFDATQFLVTQITSLALILTMGVVLPPLAVPVAVTMVVSAAYVLLKVGRLLTNAYDEKQHKYVDIIEQECANVATPATMRRAFWMLLWFGCWFYTLFLFDTLGDAVGFSAAYWVIIVVPLLPLVALVTWLVYHYRAYFSIERWPWLHRHVPAVDPDMVETPLLVGLLEPIPSEL
jgi:hypothetical protein